jgi:polysaccharide export outer membrane protein
MAPAPNQLVTQAAPQVPASSTTAAPPNAAAPALPEMPAPGSVPVDYKIGPNDLLDIEVFGVSELKRQVRVNTTGHVSMPLIGLVPLAGLSPADAEAMLAVAYADKYLQDPQVSIFVREFTTQRITLDGALVKPGIYPLVGQITLLRALAMAGGGAQMADLEKVMLFRITPEGQRLSETHDVMKIRTGEAPDPLLQSEDMVVVNRDSRRTTLRDSLFRDILDTINPFSSSYRNVTAP